MTDTAWMVAHLADPQVRVIDVDDSPGGFAKGHLPGATLVSPLSLTDPRDPIPSQALSAEALAALFSGLGIRNDQTLVLYDGGNNLYAAWAYWVLKYHRHADLRIYDGGRTRWLASGQSLVTETVSHPASQYVAATPDPALRATWQEVNASLGASGVRFVDARRAAEYAGREVQAARGGHIPGAINVEWQRATNADGSFRDLAALRDLYTTAGVTADLRVITYCQVGIRAAHTWFVLHELLGYPTVSVYDGSWAEYGNNPQSAIEQ